MDVGASGLDRAEGVRLREPAPPSEPRVRRTPPDHPSAPPSGNPWVPPSALKFTLTSADVTARFAIDEATRRVTVTMYDRETGEVLREIPPRQVLDVIAALAGTGLVVDVAT